VRKGALNAIRLIGKELNKIKKDLINNKCTDAAISPKN